MDVSVPKNDPPVVETNSSNDAGKRKAGEGGSGILPLSKRSFHKSIEDQNLYAFNYLPSTGGYYINPGNLTNSSPTSQWIMMIETLIGAGKEKGTDITEDQVCLKEQSQSTPSTSTNVNPQCSQTTNSNRGVTASNLTLPMLPKFSTMETIIKVPRVDGISQWDYLRKVAPRNLNCELRKLNDDEARNVRIQAAAYNLALFTDEFSRAMNREKIHQHTYNVNIAMNDELVKLRKQMASMKEESRLANEAKLKAENDLRIMREQDERESQQKKIAEMEEHLRLSNEGKNKAEAELQLVKEQSEKNLEQLHKELSEKQVVSELAVAEKQEAIAARLKAEGETQKLRKAIPTIFYNTIKSEYVMGPFNRLLSAAKDFGSFSMFSLMDNELELPHPLPESIQKFKDNYKLDTKESALKEMELISVPSIDQIGGPVDVDVDRILEMFK